MEQRKTEQHTNDCATTENIAKDYSDWADSGASRNRSTRSRHAVAHHGRRCEKEHEKQKSAEADRQARPRMARNGNKNDRKRFFKSNKPGVKGYKLRNIAEKSGS